jgi:hypothetical protein
MINFFDEVESRQFWQEFTAEYELEAVPENSVNGPNFKS